MSNVKHNLVYNFNINNTLSEDGGCRGGGRWLGKMILPTSNEIIGIECGPKSF